MSINNKFKTFITNTKKKKSIKYKNTQNILNKRMILYELFKDININVRNIRELLYKKIPRDIFLDKELINKCYKKIHFIQCHVMACYALIPFDHPRKIIFNSPTLFLENRDILKFNNPSKCFKMNPLF